LQRGAANLASHFVLSEDAGLVSACVHVRVCVFAFVCSADAVQVV